MTIETREMSHDLVRLDLLIQRARDHHEWDRYYMLREQRERLVDRRFRALREQPPARIEREAAG